MFAVFHDEVAEMVLAGITRILRSLLWCSRPFLLKMHRIVKMLRQVPRAA